MKLTVFFTQALWAIGACALLLLSIAVLPALFHWLPRAEYGGLAGALAGKYLHAIQYALLVLVSVLWMMDRSVRVQPRLWMLLSLVVGLAVLLLAWVMPQVALARGALHSGGLAEPTLFVRWHAASTGLYAAQCVLWWRAWYLRLGC